MLRSIVVLLGCLAATLLVSVPVLSKSERELPERFRKAPYALMSLSVGHPNDGWQLRAKRLRSSDRLKVRKDCRKNSYGHPALVLMLERTAKDIFGAQKGSVMLVGDLSDENGGPLYGHRSHQSGRDADIGFFVTDKKGRPIRSERFVAFNADGTAKDGSPVLFDDWRNWLLVKSWILDRRAGISHIFVEHGLRQRLLTFAARHPRARPHIAEAAALLKQPEHGEDHSDHFHVRISCPTDQQGLCHNESR
ncbi:MAG TPA: penicillin-insensitive murein endopeptidase [Polyangiaceae bacterium]|nr:penicillin-insensitive murein endopeptidase [Polyangiaceae bacterium]